jgi:hypothetical protein
MWMEEEKVGDHVLRCYDVGLKKIQCFFFFDLILYFWYTSLLYGFTYI